MNVKLYAACAGLFGLSLLHFYFDIESKGDVLDNYQLSELLLLETGGCTCSS